MERVVLVTGSSRGIGLAVAERFAHNGYTVVLNCRKSAGQMAAAAETIKNNGGRVRCILADVSVYGECEAMFNEIIGAYGRLDALVNNAGVSYVGLLQTMDTVKIDEMINVNLTGVIYCSKLAASAMVKQKSGSILNISSVWGRAGASCEAAYSASKGGLNALTVAMAKELGPAGVRVNAIACGVIETNMNDWLTQNERDSLINEIPLRRFGKPEEIAGLACFLAGEDAAYITGQIINIDGGMT